jgi:hypothetical protein
MHQQKVKQGKYIQQRRPFTDQNKRSSWMSRRRTFKPRMAPAIGPSNFVKEFRLG